MLRMTRGAVIYYMYCKQDWRLDRSKKHANHQNCLCSANTCSSHRQVKLSWKQYIYRFRCNLNNNGLQSPWHCVLIVVWPNPLVLWVTILSISSHHDSSINIGEPRRGKESGCPWLLVVLTMIKTSSTHVSTFFKLVLISPHNPHNFWVDR